MAEWRTVFWVTFAVFVVTTIVYVIWASGEVQPWNEPEGHEIAEDGEGNHTDIKTVDGPPSFTATVLVGVAAPITINNDQKALEAAQIITTTTTADSKDQSEANQTKTTTDN